MNQLKNTLKRLKSKSDVEALKEENAPVESKPDKKRAFKAKPEMLIAYTHDGIKKSLTEFAADAEKLNFGELAGLPKLLQDFDSIISVLNVHRVNEIQRYFPLLIKSKVEGAKGLVDTISNNQESDEKQFVSVRADLKAAVQKYKSEKAGGKEKSLVKVGALKKTLAEFAETQQEHLKSEEKLYGKATTEVFTPADVAAAHMRKILDTDRDSFEKVLLPFILEYIIGTGRSGKLRQLVDSVQRSSSVADFRKYRVYLEEKISERLWAKLCKLGYDADLAEDDDDKEGAQKENKAAPKKQKKGSKGTGRLRTKLLPGDTVAFPDPLTGNRQTGEVLEMIDGGRRLVLKTMKESELHSEPLELLLYVAKNKCKKVVSAETFAEVLAAAAAKEKKNDEKKEGEPKKKEKKADQKKADQKKVSEEKPVALASEKVAKKAEKEKKPKKAAAEKAPKEEKKEEAAPVIAAAKEDDIVVEDPASGPFALLLLANEALRSAVGDLQQRVDKLTEAFDKDAVAGIVKDFDAVSASAAVRFALENDEFVSSFVAKNKVSDLRDERKFDAAERKAIAELLSKLEEAAGVKKLASRFAEWAEDHRGGLDREEKLIRTGSPDAEDVLEALQESVARERAAFDKDLAPFVSSKLEGSLLDAWKAAVENAAAK